MFQPANFLIREQCPYFLRFVINTMPKRAGSRKALPHNGFVGCGVGTSVVAESIVGVTEVEGVDKGSVAA